MASHKTVLILLLILLLLLIATPARAQGPTPTPTPQPMPTGAFQGLRPTPTYWPTSQATPLADFHMDTRAGEVADSIINVYHWANLGSADGSAGIIDFMLLFFMIFIVIQSLWSFISSGGDDGE